jgi:uridine kinase
LAIRPNHTKGEPLPASLNKLEETPQIKMLHTIIRNKETSRDEFIFYSNRLMRLLIEYALSLLPFDVSLSFYKIQEDH